MKTKLPAESRRVTSLALADRLAVRCTPEELHRWDVASRPGTRTTSEWARAVLNEKAAEILDTRRAFSAPKSEDIEDRALAVCRRLRITRRDLSRITLAAALDAIEAKLTESGSLTFPLSLEVASPEAEILPFFTGHFQASERAAATGGEE